MVFVAQLVISLALSALATIYGKVQAYSLLLGTSLFIVPNVYFTYYAFRYRGTALTPLIRRSFMQGEMGKMSLAAVGFAMALVFVKPLSVEYLFAGFALMMAIQWPFATYIARLMQRKAEANDPLAKG